MVDLHLVELSLHDKPPDLVDFGKLCLLNRHLDATWITVLQRFSDVCTWWWNQWWLCDFGEVHCAGSLGVSVDPDGGLGTVGGVAILEALWLDDAWAVW